MELCTYKIHNTAPLKLLIHWLSVSLGPTKSQHDRFKLTQRNEVKCPMQSFLQIITNSVCNNSTIQGRLFQIAIQKYFTDPKGKLNVVVTHIHSNLMF